MLGRCLDTSQPLSRRLGDTLGDTHNEQLRVAHYGVERCSQVMRDNREEICLRLVCLPCFLVEPSVVQGECAARSNVLRQR